MHVVGLCIVLDPIGHQAALWMKVANCGDTGEAVNQHPLDAASSSQLVIVNGVLSAELSSLSSIPDGVYVGGLQHAPAQAVSQHLVSCALDISTA